MCSGENLYLYYSVIEFIGIPVPGDTNGEALLISQCDNILGVSKNVRNVLAFPPIV